MTALTAAATRIETGPAVWLEQLTQRGALHWQHGSNNLGLLLAGLLEVNGWQGDILALCDALPCATGAVSLPDILGVMAALGFRIRQERMALANLQPEDMPGLFIPAHAPGWRSGLILRELGAYGLVWDDGRGQQREALPAQDGVFYRFERLSSDTAEIEVAAPAWLALLGERFRPLLWHAAGLSLLMNVFTLAMPIFSMAIYDRVIGAHAADTLPLLTIGVLLALGLEHVIRWLRIRIASWIGSRSGILATASMFERLLFLPASLIEQASVSSQLARIRAFESVRDFITGPAFLTILEVPFLGLLVLVIALLAGPVAWIAAGLVVAQIGLIALLRPRWRKLGRETAHAAAARQQLLMDTIENTKAIYAAGLSERMLQRFRQVSWAAAKSNYRFTLNAAVIQHVAGLLTVVAGVATIDCSIQRIWANEMTGGAMVATMILTWRVLYPLQTLCAVMPQLEQMRGSLLQVGQLMANAPEAHAAHIVLAEHPLRGKISIQNIGLRYGRKSDPVFVGLSCEIKPGEIVAIQGGNGTGKSSILRLLLGLYAPAMGSIRFDDVDHRQFDPRSLRRQIAYLPQASEFLPGTLGDNLRVHNPLIEDYRLRQALLWADAWELVEQLPAGLDTVIGEDGFTPSSGFAARLALARLYLTDQPVVLCDELPGQLLNSTTGERFRRFIEDCRGKRTLIFIAHREDWLNLADKVIVLQADARPVVTRPQTAGAKVA